MELPKKCVWNCVLEEETRKETRYREFLIVMQEQWETKQNFALVKVFIQFFYCIFRNNIVGYKR